MGATLLKQLKAILKLSIQKNRRWGIKLPSASLLMPIYQAAFDELRMSPHYVVCVRNPADFVNAPIRWAHGPYSRAVPPLGDLAVGVWLRHTLGALEVATRGNFSVVLYENFCESPREVLDGIVRSNPGWSPTGEQWAAVAGAEGRALLDPLSLDDFPALVSHTYDVCRQLAEGKDRIEQLRTIIDEFNLWREMFAKPGNPGTRVVLAWTDRGKARTAQVPFLPTGDWQTVRLEIDAPTSTVLSGMLYDQPCQIWIRRCSWISHDRQEAARLRAGIGCYTDNSEGTLRLDAVYDPKQISLATPEWPGPFGLEFELLLETGPQTCIAASRQLASLLRHCIVEYQLISTEMKR